GFGLFWTGLTPELGLIGLTLMGLGVANLYPTILALMMHSAGELKGLAGARATLASGTAIFSLPMILGSLADQTGIKQAFLIVLGLFVLLGVVLIFAAQMQKQDQNIKQENTEKS
ncbi:MAG: MFS transporter, partial [Anaerolineaceae bacterium]